MIKPLHWMGSSRRDIRKIPQDVQDGFGLYEAQLGEKYQYAKVLKGFGGASVLEIMADEDGNTYRAVYTVKFPSAVYVLHVFQKKSKKGIATPSRTWI